LQRAFESHGPPEAQHTALFDELLGLLKTAVESMADAAYAGPPAQVREQYVLRAAHVQDRRQTMAHGQVQLRGIKPLLLFPHRFGLKFWNKKIQADLANAHETGIAQGGFDLALQRV